MIGLPSTLTEVWTCSPVICGTAAAGGFCFLKRNPMIHPRPRREETLVQLPQNHRSLHILDDHRQRAPDMDDIGPALHNGAVREALTVFEEHHIRGLHLIFWPQFSPHLHDPAHIFLGGLM